MVLLAVLQLFSIEKYQAVFETWGLAGGAVTAGLLAGLLPLLEIASVPYLISMKLGARVLDLARFAAVAVGAFWFFGEVYAAWFAHGALAAIFGASAHMLAGWVTVLFAAFLLAACLLVVAVLRPGAHLEPKRQN